LDEGYNYRAEEGVDPNLRFTITIPNNEVPYEQSGTGHDLTLDQQQQGQVDPQLLQQVVQSLLSTSVADPSQVGGSTPNEVNGSFATLDPNFLAQLQDTISQAGLFNTANNLNALVSNTDVSRFFPVEDTNSRGRFYGSGDTSEHHEVPRHSREEDYYYDRERLIDRNLSRFYNAEKDRSLSPHDNHRADPRGSSPPRLTDQPRGHTSPRDSHRGESRGSSPPHRTDQNRRRTSPRSNSPPRQSRTPNDASQLSEEDLLLQARRAMESSKSRAEESRGQKRASPDNISDRPEKRQKTSSDSALARSPTATDKNKPTTSSESSKSETSVRKSTNRSSSTDITVTNGPSKPNTSSAMSNTNAAKPNEAPKTSNANAVNSTVPSPKTSAAQSSVPMTPSKGSSTEKQTTSPSSTAVSSKDTGSHMEVDASSGSASSAIVSNGSTAGTTGGSDGAQNESTHVSADRVGSGTPGNTAGSTGVQSGSSATNLGGPKTNSLANVPASKSTAPSTIPKAPTAGKSTSIPNMAQPVVFVPVKTEPVRNNTNTVPQQNTAVSIIQTADSTLQAAVEALQPDSISTTLLAPSVSQAVQTQPNIQQVQSTMQTPATNLLDIAAKQTLVPSTEVPAHNTNLLPITSNPLAPPGLPPPVSSTSRSLALGFIKNMLEDNPVMPQPPSSPISPPRSPKRIDKPQVWHGYLAKRGTIACDVVAYYLGGSDLWRKL